ncbi:hypothetical protein F9L07_28520 [Pimelobacter simplex]|uniref:Uncharacterized protein n=1 Tax=Nocardioides simplex TaxID=2045 RepID=A0A7J5DQX1_NOCSI|nr:hypothetical protein [Pimelobacter simplex]KAB2806980.1 hypothetical protein F9L07_28520 [Pimelobacter simplex]
MSDLDTYLDRACADGRLTVEDADEVRRFGDFLRALMAAGARPGSPEAVRVYAEHYPDNEPHHSLDGRVATE